VNEDRPLLLSETSLSHSSVIVSASLLLAALMGAGQALLVVFIVGEGNDTDAFLAGYSIYFVFAGFGASMRASVVPLLGHAETDEGFRARVADVLSRIRLIGLVALGVLLLVSPVAGQVLTHGLPADDRWTAVLTVLILSPAAYMQLQAASASAALTAGRRFLYSATLYVVSGVVALACSAVLLEAIGILGGAFGLLAGAVVLGAGHALYLRSFGIRLRPRARWLRERELWRLALALLAGASIGIALQVNLAISLATISSHAGAITAYSYAYFMATVILTISSLPLGLVTLPDLVSRLAREGKVAAEQHFMRVAPYALAVVAPLVFAYAADGRPLLDAIFADSLSNSTIDLLFDIGLWLCAMIVPAALMVLAAMVSLALGRWRQYLLTALGGIAVHAAIVIPVSTLGPREVAAGHFASAVVMCALVMRTAYGPRAAAVAFGALRRAAPAFAFATVLLLLRLPLGSDPGWAAALGSALAGALVYCALALRFWPSVSTAFVDLVRRPRAAASTSAGSPPVR
jgi:peptidoglycan biosynthesis protein MviN/MurJ (putative lipid II flippase)